MESMTWEVITPELAKEYLDHNIKGNRPISKTMVGRYARDMKEGNWDVHTTDNKITFNDNGELVDGQHRLIAITKAGIPIKMRVFRGVNSSVFDRGRARSTFDLVYMNGMKTERTTVSLAKGVMEKVMDVKNVTDTDIEMLLKLDNNLLRDAVVISRVGSHNPITKKVGCQVAIYCALKLGIRYEMLEDMFKQTNSLIPLNEDSVSAFVLNKSITKIMAKDKGKRDEPYSVKCFNVTTQAIKDYYNGARRTIAYREDKNCYKELVKAMLTEQLGIK